MRRSTKLLYVVLATFLLVELLLQAGALIVHVRFGGSRGQVHAAESGPRVLCVGDSFTFGQGASSRELSYPAALERQLAEAYGIEAQVTNAGWPGQDSRDVLLGLEQQLQATRPDILVVLVGVNDRWNLPTRTEPEAAAQVEEGFRLRFRSARLLRWLLRDQRGAAWRSPTYEETGPEAVQAAAALLDSVGVAVGPGSPAIPHTPELEQALALARQELDARRFPEALAGLMDALQGLEHPALRRLQLEALVRLGRSAEAAEVLAGLEQHWRHAPDEEGGLMLLQALQCMEQEAQLLEHAQDYLAKFPRVTLAWRVLARTEQARDDGQAAHAFQRAIETAGELGRRTSEDVAGLARSLVASDPERATPLVIAGLLLQGDHQGYAKVALSYATQFVSEERMLACLDATGLSEEQRAPARQAIQAAHRKDDLGWIEVLRHHLEGMVGLAAERGTDVVFVEYPFENKLAWAKHSAATRTGARFVELHTRFDRELETRGRSELFAADGHCNDAGYEILAEEVRGVVAELLGAR